MVSYDFKERRFANLHRSAINFPKSRFFYAGTPASMTSKEAALKGEALVRAQFQDDPFGCQGSLYRKKLGRDPFHRSIPYPNGCPEIAGLFRYCRTDPYSHVFSSESYTADEWFFLNNQVRSNILSGNTHNMPF